MFLPLTFVYRDWWTALSNSIGCTLSDNSTCWDGINSSGYDDGQYFYEVKWMSR